MNTAHLLRGIGFVLVLLASDLSGRAEETAKTPAKEPTPAVEKPKPAAAETAPAPTTPSTNAPSTSVAGLPPAGSALLDLSNREVAGATSTSVRQVAPEPIIKEPPIRSLDERGGALRYLAKEPKVGNLLQLINPFAPMSLGQGGRLVNEWSPLDGAAPVPRGFRDEGTHEPMSLLIGWP